MIYVTKYKLHILRNKLLFLKLQVKSLMLQVISSMTPKLHLPYSQTCENHHLKNKKNTIVV